MKRQNCTFEKVEILPHKIGDLKLTSFPDPAICGAIAQAAMEQMNQANVIIFDLRDNTGGLPEMVAGRRGLSTFGKDLNSLVIRSSGGSGHSG
jgi:C-terminal processing protease CtpA/Prc